MDVFRSLITPGCLVRTPIGHGVVSAFDARHNISTVRFNPGGAEGRYHFTKLLAGNDETEKHVTGEVTKSFPKVGWSSDEQRVLATPDYRTGRIG